MGVELLSPEFSGSLSEDLEALRDAHGEGITFRSVSRIEFLIYVRRDGRESWLEVSHGRADGQRLSAVSAGQIGSVIIADLTVIEAAQADSPRSDMLSNRKLVAIFDTIFVVGGLIAGAEVNLKTR